jgi:hypothetical protein
MKPNFQSDSEGSAEIVQNSSDREIGSVKSSNEMMKNTELPEQISVTVGSSSSQFSISQSVVMGLVTVAIVGTFFLVTRGSDYCFLSSCNDIPFDNPITTNFWSFAGGLGMFGILSLMGISAPVAVLGALGLWLLMQMSL